MYLVDCSVLPPGWGLGACIVRGRLGLFSFWFLASAYRPHPSFLYTVPWIYNLVYDPNFVLATFVFLVQMQSDSFICTVEFGVSSCPPPPARTHTHTPTTVNCTRVSIVHYNNVTLCLRHGPDGCPGGSSISFDTLAPPRVPPRPRVSWQT
eukprot:COSAG02_NODE_2792_length_8019_cov_6.816793_3_plen_151_part_00